MASGVGTKIPGLLLVAACSGCGGEDRPGDAGDVDVELGEPGTLLGDGAFGIHYFPDMAVVPLAHAPRLRLLVTAGNSTYLVEGTDLAHLESARIVLEPGPPGAFDNGYAGISGLHRDASGQLYGFYHAEDHEGLPPLEGSGLPGFYGTVGAAVSDDDGASWQSSASPSRARSPRA